MVRKNESDFILKNMLLVLYAAMNRYFIVTQQHRAQNSSTHSYLFEFPKGTGSQKFKKLHRALLCHH